MNSIDREHVDVQMLSKIMRLSAEIEAPKNANPHLNKNLKRPYKF